MYGEEIRQTVASETEVSALAAPKSSALAPLDLMRMLSIALIWGVNNVAAKLAVMALPALMVVSLRFAVVLVLLGALIRPLPRGHWGAMALILLLTGPLHFGVQYVGLGMARELAPMVIAMQLWIPSSVLFAGLILKERIGAFRVGGVTLAFAGIVAMSFDPIVFAQGAALLLVAIAAAAYGLGAVLVRRIGTAIDPWAMQAWTALLCAPTIGLASFAFEHGQLEAAARAPWWIWSFILFGAVVSSIVANAFMFRLVQIYEVSRITPYMLMTPVISFVMAALVLHDHISLRVAIGGALTLAGVALVAMAERRFRAAS